MAWTAGHQAAADTVYNRIEHGQCADVTAELDLFHAVAELGDQQQED